MKSPSTHRQTRRGFTLIELLVVIAIIVVLAAMGFGVGASAIKRARNLTDRASATSLSQAIEGYFDEYSTLPEVDGASGDTDAEVISDKKLMNILMAFGTEGEKLNPKEFRYYSGKAAKGTTRAKAYGGLFYTGKSSVDLFNVWKKKSDAEADSEYYQVIMDTNYDDEIADPVKNDTSIYNRRSLIWSMGADGKHAEGKENDQKNRDNVYSWKN